MSIATEILNLRRNKFSSMSTLLSAIDRYLMTQCAEHIETRRYAMFDAADALLVNVAAHAAEAMSESPENRKVRRTAVRLRRKTRRSGPGQLRQRLIA